MSEGPDIHAAAAQAEDRDAARLEALADLDLAMARRANEAALAAEDDRALCDLAHAYQRASRSLRQTLALKAKLRGERLQEVRRAEIFAPWPGPSRPAAADPDPRRHAALAMAPPDAPSRAPATPLPPVSPDEMAERRFRFEVIAEGVFDTALHEGLDRAEARDHAERFRAEAHDWIEAPDFLREDLRRQLGRAYRLAARPRNGGARHGGPRPASTEPPRADPDKPRPRTPSPQAAPRNAGRLGPPDPRPTPAPPRLRLIPRVPDTNVRARQRRFEPPRHQGRQAVRSSLHALATLASWR